jgi:hypothetical protein
VHGLLSLQTRGTCVHVPVAPVQPSFVQALLSLQFFGACTHRVPAALHESVVHKSLSAQSTGPPTQAPPAQLSCFVHSLPSSQVAVFGVPMHKPVASSQESLVQTLSSSQFG